MSVIVLPALQMGLENDRPGRRRAMLLTVTVSGAALFVLPPLRALIGFWRDDEEYAKRLVWGGCQGVRTALNVNFVVVFCFLLL